MRSRLNSILLLLLLGGIGTLGSPLFGQDMDGGSLWSVQVTVFTETFTAKPGFRWLQHPLNPGVKIGVQRRIAGGERHDLYVGADLGFFHHQQIENGLFLSPSFGYRYHVKPRFSVEAQLGAGYLQNFHASPVYAYENGQWQAVPDRGVPRFMPSLGLGLAYQLNEKPTSPRIHLSYAYAVELPLTVYAHQFWGLGASLYPF